MPHEAWCRARSDTTPRLPAMGIVSFRPTCVHPRRCTDGFASRSGWPLLIRHHPLERLAEIELEVIPLGPAEMRRAENVRHRQERMIAAGDRLLLVDVDRGIAG